MTDKTNAKKKNEKKSKSKKIKKVFLLVLAFIAIFTIVSSYYFFDYVLQGIPSFDELENPKSQLASNIYSSDGELIDQFYLENRINTPLDSIPPYVVNALIATEDQKFYDHWGVNLDRLAKAIFKTIFLGKREGGSTITQQLAKNLFKLQTGPESFFDTVVRKFREWVTAVEIEKNYTKNEIIEMYFNTHFLGKRTYGIGMAAKAYFNKKPSKLTIPEGAVIIALFNKPNRYNPDKHYDLALKKRNQIMYNMVNAGFLSKEEYKKFKEEPINLPEGRTVDGLHHSIAPHFVEMIRQNLEEIGAEENFDIHKDGLTIYTTLDSRMQKIANEVIEKHLSLWQKHFDKNWNWEKHKDILDDILDTGIKRSKKYRLAKSIEEKNKVYKELLNDKQFTDSIKTLKTRIDVGFIVLDSKTGEIRAMVGGRNQNNGRGWNHVTQMKRQPGSAFKPIIYTIALDHGLYPAFPLLNQPFTIDGWRPQNFSNRYGGFLTLREGLKHSVNVIAARLILEGYVELWEIPKYAKAMGVKTRFTPYISNALGTTAVSPLELASVYSTLANKGIYNEPSSLTSIEDKDGILIKKFIPETHEAISAETDYLMVNMMESVINEGTGVGVRYRFGFWRDCAGKTGTTQDYRNAWFAGFTPQLTAVVWVGFNDERIGFYDLPNHDGQGGRTAMPIWAMFMKEVYDKLELPEEEFQIPESGEIVYVDFCKEAIDSLGLPRLYSSDCNGKKYTDIIKVSSDLPFYNSSRDTFLNVSQKFFKYAAIDSNSHEALEIVKEDSTILN